MWNVQGFQANASIPFGFSETPKKDDSQKLFFGLYWGFNILLAVHNVFLLRKIGLKALCSVAAYAFYYCGLTVGADILLCGHELFTSEVVSTIMPPDEKSGLNFMSD
jgi:hypothetical protein